MPQGLQVFDEKGNITINITDRLARVIGRRFLDTKKGSFWIEGLRKNEKVFAYTIPKDDSEQTFPVDVEIMEHTITWEYNERNPYYENKKRKYWTVLVYGTY